MFLFLSPTFNSPPSLSSSFFFFSRLFLFLAVLWKFMHYTRINRAVASIFDEIINQFFSRLSQMALSKLDRDLRDESTFRVTSLIFVIASRVRFAKNTIPRRFEFHTGNYCIDREIDTGLKIQRNTKRLLRLN